MNPVNSQSGYVSEVSLFIMIYRLANEYGIQWRNSTYRPTKEEWLKEAKRDLCQMIIFNYNHNNVDKNHQRTLEVIINLIESL